MYWLRASVHVYVCIIYIYMHEDKGQHISFALSDFFWRLAAANCCKVPKHHLTRPGMVPATPIVRWEWGQLARPKCGRWVGRFERGVCVATQLRQSCSGLVSHWAFFHKSLLIFWVLGFDLCTSMSHHESSMAKCSLVMPSYGIDWTLRFYQLCSRDSAANSQWWDSYMWIFLVLSNTGCMVIWGYSFPWLHS